MSDDDGRVFRRNILRAFSGYRAEWLGAEIFRLFTEPSYFPQLTTSRPCFLVGGRGTGKTTALRCLSYEGQSVLYNGESSSAPQELGFVGMYLRINTNRVRAFGGPELSPNLWLKLFGHYINMELTGLVLKFLSWHARRNPDHSTIDEVALRKFGISLHLGPLTDLQSAQKELELARLRFEATINNVADSRPRHLSLLSVPIDVLIAEVRTLPQFSATSFFFLIDEYENLDGPQQRVLNTLIKHCGEHYSFKVSVREFGIKHRSTLSDQEHLTHPADYVLIDIASELEGRFADFAARVCNQRLHAVFRGEFPDIRSLFPGLSPESEAQLLGVDAAARTSKGDLLRSASLTDEERLWLTMTDPLQYYVLESLSNSERKTLLEKLREVIRHPSRWQRQYENYKYAFLFTIRRGRRGIRKYYCGWRVYCAVASENIRYLLELVDRAFGLYSRDAVVLAPVDVGIQTRAAQATGQNYLRELEGLSLNGARLTRLVLGIGRVFQVMAANPFGHTPEVNQFNLSSDIDDADHRNTVSQLVQEGVMHLAILRYPGSKLQAESDTRQFDYVVHPIFAPFFVFGHRRKRKIGLSDEHMIGLVERPKETIARLLREQRRYMDDEAEETVDALPEQMDLFSDFYE